MREGQQPNQEEVRVPVLSEASWWGDPEGKKKVASSEEGRSEARIERRDLSQHSEG